MQMLVLGGRIFSISSRLQRVDDFFSLTKFKCPKLNNLKNHPNNPSPFEKHTNCKGKNSKKKNCYLKRELN